MGLYSHPGSVENSYLKTPAFSNVFKEIKLCRWMEFPRVSIVELLSWSLHNSFSGAVHALHNSDGSLERHNSSFPIEM